MWDGETQTTVTHRVAEAWSQGSHSSAVHSQYGSPGTYNDLPMLPSGWLHKIALLPGTGELAAQPSSRDGLCLLMLSIDVYYDHVLQA